MIIMSVDYGDRRTGLAVCDKSEILASPVGTLCEGNPAYLIEKIVHFACEKSVEMFVVGEPLNMDGTRGERAVKCAAFAEELSRVSGLPHEMYDERLTTVSAAAALNLTDTRGKKRKAALDPLSAVIILEAFMAKRKNTMKSE